jgi:hypothetical protein
VNDVNDGKQREQIRESVCVWERVRVRRKEEGKERKEERIEEHVSFNFVCLLFFSCLLCQSFPNP